MGVAPPLDSIRIDEKIKPVEIDTEAILAIGMLSSLPPISRGLIRATLSGEISIRVGKIAFPEVSRLAVKTRGAVIRASISRPSPFFWADRVLTDDEVHHDREIDAHGPSVHQRRAVSPLAHASERGLLPQRVARREDPLRL